jgi:fibronectin type 3 domain-containing protein
MIDDICITPAQLDSWVVDHYKLYRYDNYDWNTYKKVADNITATSYTDDTVGDNNAAYMLYTVVKSDDSELEGPRSNIVKAYSSGVDEITNLEGIYGGKGEILVEGHVNAEMALYTTDGKFVKLCTLNSDAARVACDAGIYLVKIGNAYAKVIVR